MAEASESPMATVIKTFPPCAHDHRHMIEIRQTKDRGQSIYASRDIPRGTIILSEAPLLEAIEEPGSASVLELFEALSPCKQQAYSQLHGNDDKSAKPELMTRDTVFSIYNTNKFKTTVLEIGSRFNHSCIPSAELIDEHHDHETRHRFVTLRHVGAGEEVTISYVAAYEFLKERKPALSKVYGFSCDCPACGDGIQRHVLEAIAVANEKLNDKIRKMTFENHNSVELHQRRLPDLDDLASLLEFDGGLGRVAHDWQATISSAVLGKADLALNWARKASDISLHHVGPRHIQHKRDREIVEGLESIEMKRIISKAVAWQDRDLHEFEDNYESKCDCDEITWPGKNLMSWVAMLVRRGPVYWDDEWEVAQR
ncbi:hypothetical protein EG328_010574 [Venturia inaequalis]|uniref:SET domain-containing protein n=1 Tax=Venturia inaequalis TaxID=5025 RepID=A0A8H3ZB14_VENIN|nr:hypothetical protein EG328_010574 [Venturia inaequalis]KAE9992364.1 hypothetical protein EG327_009318 [Venturia inaequalis]